MKKILTNPLFAGSLVMIVGNNAVNFLNYIYHLIMGRFLGPSIYGELAALLSLLGLLAMIPFSLGLVIIKFISSAKSEEEVKVLVHWFRKRVYIFGVGIFLVVTIGSFWISSFLNINNPALITLLGATFIFSLPSFLYRSVLQGLLKFKQMVVSILGENSIKLILGATLVYFGFSIYGAILALLLAIFVGWILSKGFLNDYLTSSGKGVPQIDKMLSYSFPVLLQSVSMMSLFSADLILIKHFFSPHESGIYAAISTLGKIIFFAAGPVGAVMFPMVSSRQARGIPYNKMFFLSFVLVFILAVAILLFYLFLPSFAISILFGKLYLEGTPYLLWFGIFMTLLTLCALIISFHLSLGQTRVVILPLLASFLQVILIWIYHQSIFQVLGINILVTSLLFFSLSVYFAYVKAGPQKKN